MKVLQQTAIHLIGDRLKAGLGLKKRSNIHNTGHSALDLFEPPLKCL
jgi:hypothetical protein